LNVELLTTIAECAIAFAGFSALAVIVPQLAGVPWRGQMATGLWLMVSWSLTAFLFSLLPLVLQELGLDASTALSWSSLVLAVSVLAQGALAGNRDRKLARQSVGEPPQRVVHAARILALAVFLMLLVNGFGGLPGAQQGWYLTALLSLFLLAVVPLSLFLAALASDRDPS
jgi:hypothetical protein